VPSPCPTMAPCALRYSTLVMRKSSLQNGVVVGMTHSHGL
jgi:hypothetical protein